MRIGRSLFVSLLLVALMGAAQAAHATPQLRIYEGGSFSGGVHTGGTLLMDILDNDANDADGGALGMILFVGPLGNWSFDLLGLSTPVTGGAIMEIHGAITGGLGASLFAYLSDDGFTGGAGYFSLDTTGTTDGVLSGLAYKSFGGPVFGPVDLPNGTPLTTPGGTGGFAQSVALTHGIIPNYSMTIGFSLVGADTQGTSINMTAQNVPVEVPEPITISLLGLGLAGIGAAARRKSR